MTSIERALDVTNAPSSDEPAAPPVAARGFAAAAIDVIALTKPKIALMAVIVAGGTWLMTTTSLAPIDLLRGLCAMAGIASAVMGAGALNMMLERDIDRLMERTRLRPLAARRLDPWVALVVGVVLSLAAVPLLLVGSNPLTAGLAMFSLFVYVALYTPMKRTSPWALVVGALPGAMPAFMGATAATGKLELVGASIFGVAFVWQLPHFLAISIYREREYTAAGHRIFPATHGLRASQIAMVVTSVLLSALGIALWPLHVTGALAGVVAIVLGVWFTGECALAAWRKGARSDVDARARRVFFASLAYQTFLFAAIGLDALLRRGGTT